MTDQSDAIFDKMMTAAFETCDALTDFYCHMEDVRRNMLAGTPLPEMKAIEVAGAVHEAHDKYFEAACAYEDLPCECAKCQAEKAAAPPVVPEVKPPTVINSRLH
mgnify:CR=1 FL=1